MPDSMPAPPPGPPHPLLSPQPAVASSLPPLCRVDLMTAAGSALLGAVWRVREAKIVERPPLADAMPEYTSAYDIDPHAGEAGYDDSAWQTVPPTDLGTKRGGGYVSFLWFRARLTIPSRIGDFDPTGAGAVLHINVDDYGEIWVNGELPRAAGRPSPATIQGFNMPNRLVLAPSVQPGDSFQLAVFGINGPISAAPPNTVWFREARVEFFR